MPISNEQSIIDAVQKGDYEQFELLVVRYHRGLIQHLYNLAHDAALAEDVAQEAFIRAYDKLDSFNPDYAFSTWLYRIADNILFRQLKQTRPSVDIDDLSELLPDDSPSVAEMTDKAFTKESIQKAVQTLPAAYQQVITLYYWEDKSYEEIAAVLERPVNTVRTWLRRAKDQLRKELYGQI